MHELTILYDGLCPLCSAEMRQLRQQDRDHKIRLIDIHDDEFQQFGIDKQAANALLHGVLPDGRFIYGLDVTCYAWKLVGKHRWLAVLRWPIVRPIADRTYRFFARHRQRISTLLTGSSECQRCRID